MNFSRFFCVLFILLAPLAGCTLREEVHLTPQQFVEIVEPEQLPDDPRDLPNRFQLDPDFPQPGYTYALGRPGKWHGVQVEYFSSNGDVYLWYPGNVRTVFGKYRFRGWALPGELPKKQSIGGIEFKYGTNTYNPLTKEYGGDWEWRDIDDMANEVKSYAKGDIFNLASGRVPYARLECDLPAPLQKRPSVTNFCETPRPSK